MEMKNQQEIQTADEQSSGDVAKEFKHPHEKYYKSVGRKVGTATAMVLNFGLWCRLLVWGLGSISTLLSDSVYISSLAKWKRDELIPVIFIGFISFVLQFAYTAYVIWWHRRYRRKQFDGTITEDDISKSMWTYPVYMLVIPSLQFVENILKDEFVEGYAPSSVGVTMILACVIVSIIVALLYGSDLCAYQKYVAHKDDEHDDGSGETEID